MMTVRLIAHTPEPEKVVAAAAKLCYSDAHITDLLEGLTEEKTARFLTMLSDLGHASPIEHASFTFGIEGVSRTLLAQITRHRIASFSVQSQRYVRLDDFHYVIPPEIAEIPEAKAAFVECREEDARRYLDLAHNLRCCSRAQWEIRQLAEEMFRLVYPVAPHIFAKAGPACVSGPCPEGKMCCGRTAEVRAKYAALKGEAQS